MDEIYSIIEDEFYKMSKDHILFDREVLFQLSIELNLK